MYAGQAIGLIVFVLALAGEHVDQGLDVDEAFVVDVHVVVRVVDFPRGEFLAVGHQRVPQSVKLTDSSF